MNEVANDIRINLCVAASVIIHKTLADGTKKEGEAWLISRIFPTLFIRPTMIFL